MSQIISILALSLCLVDISSASDLILEADSFYDRRGEGFDSETLTARSVNIDKAIELYEKAIESTSGPAKEEALWKLIRAYQFKGAYTTADKKARKAIQRMIDLTNSTSGK